MLEILPSKRGCQQAFALISLLSMHIRKYFGEFRRRRHDETLFGGRPSDEMLYVGVLEHAAKELVRRCPQR